jgi:hypothetical protein
MTHIDDDDLRARFKQLADHEAHVAPVFSRPAAAGQRRWLTPRRMALAAATFVVAALTLTIGLVLGTSTGYASARREGARERDVIAASTEGVTRQLAALRGDLAQMRTGLMRLAEKGTVAHASLLAAEAAVDSMSANVARIEASLNTSDDSSSRPALAILRTIPVRNALTALTCGAVTPGPLTKAKQQGIPVVTLPGASAKTTQTLGSVLSIRQAPDGKVLVNDGSRRQIKLFEPSLDAATVVFDSLAGTSTSYGRGPAGFTPYLGDSVLFADFNARAMLVLDGHGRIVRSLALSNPQNLGNIAHERSVTDDHGRILYTGLWRITNPNGPVAGPVFGDSLSIVRIDLDQRRSDTLGLVARPVAKVAGITPDGKSVMAFTGVDPIATIDDWALLSDGSVAIVRGKDYHIDWIRPNGTTASTPKLPFDWKRLSEDDKRRIFDSTRTAMLEGFANGTLRPYAISSLPTNFDPNAPRAAGGGGRAGGGAGGDPGGDGRCGIGCGIDKKTLIRQPEPVPVDKLADFYPPIRAGTTLADEDGNLWILPTTSTVSKQGELVYDVVNTKGELFQRVRVPLGRLIVGFGKGGVVYMTSGDKATGFYLERSKLPAVQKATPK